MTNAILTEDLEIVSKTLCPLFNALEGRRVFLTGGTGFFGKWLLHSFLVMRKDYGVDVELTVLSRNPKLFLETCSEFSGQRGLDFIEGDVRSFTLPSDRTFDFVIHGATAASAKLEREAPEEMYSVISEGTRHVLELTRRCSASRLLFISSGAVYGPQPPTLSHIPESYEGSPSTAYGRGKKISEQLCLDASAGRFECVIARPFAFVGPFLPLDTHFAIGNFIRDILSKKPIVIRCDGRPLRTYLYASDLTVWLWTLLLSGGNGVAYNVGSSEVVSITCVARLIANMFDPSAQMIIEGESDDRLPPHRYVPDTRRIEETLGVKNHYTLEEAIRRTTNFYKGYSFMQGVCENRHL